MNPAKHRSTHSMIEVRLLLANDANDSEYCLSYRHLHSSRPVECRHPELDPVFPRKIPTTRKSPIATHPDPPHTVRWARKKNSRRPDIHVWHDNDLHSTTSQNWSSICLQKPPCSCMPRTSGTSQRTESSLRKNIKHTTT